jgi:predicted dehydrogenase
MAARQLCHRGKVVWKFVRAAKILETTAQRKLEIMVRLAIVGGTAIYHALSFGGLINGVAEGKTLPEGWPQYPQCVDGARITVVWDEDRANAEKLAEIYGIEHVVDTLEEVIPLCDGVIVTDDVTRNHCRHAPIFLERGIPTFIDKPLGPDAATAQQMVELAEKHGAPLMSGSALRYAAESEALRADPDLLGEINLASAAGPNDLFFYGIHPMELAHSILGGGIQSVQNIGEEDTDIVKIKYRDGRLLVLMVSRVAGFGFEVTLYGTKGRERIVVSDATAFYGNQMRLVVQMVREKKAPVPIDDALEVIRVLDAGQQSLAEGGRVIEL